jgi:hypothetical protein
VLVRTPEQLVGVADHAVPGELANPIDHFGRAGAHEREVATVQDQVGTPMIEVCGNRLERGEIAVNVGDQRDAYLRSSAAHREDRRRIALEFQVGRSAGEAGEQFAQP